MNYLPPLILGIAAGIISYRAIRERNWVALVCLAAMFAAYQWRVYQLQ